MRQCLSLRPSGGCLQDLALLQPILSCGPCQGSSGVEPIRLQLPALDPGGVQLFCSIARVAIVDCSSFCGPRESFSTARLYQKGLLFCFLLSLSPPLHHPPARLQRDNYQPPLHPLTLVLARVLGHAGCRASWAIQQLDVQEHRRDNHAAIHVQPSRGQDKRRTRPALPALWGRRAVAPAQGIRPEEPTVRRPAIRLESRSCFYFMSFIAD